MSASNSTLSSAKSAASVSAVTVACLLLSPRMPRSPKHDPGPSSRQGTSLCAQRSSTRQLDGPVGQRFAFRTSTSLTTAQRPSMTKYTSVGASPCRTTTWPARKSTRRTSPHSRSNRNLAHVPAGRIYDATRTPYDFCGVGVRKASAASTQAPRRFSCGLGDAVRNMGVVFRHSNARRRSSSRHFRMMRS